MPTRDVLRLAGLLACVALATSRLGLVGHELLGHGGTALALGAQVSEVRLFWFAGGWIRYQLAEPTTAAALAVAMGGIAVELVAGTALWLGVRGDGLGRRIVRGVAAALVLHACWYLATGAWQGFGDGVLLYRVLGPGRVPVALGAGAVACVAGYVGAREVLGALAGTIEGTRGQRIAGTVVALVLAGGLHAALAVGELRFRRDATYAETMRPERERVIAREMVRWTAAQARDGAPVDEAARRAERARLERAHRTFPFAWLLGGAVALAIALGAARARAGDGRLSPRLLRIAAAVAAVSIFAVVVIDLVASG